MEQFPAEPGNNSILALKNFENLPLALPQTSLIYNILLQNTSFPPCGQSQDAADIIPHNAFAETLLVRSLFPGRGIISSFRHTTEE